MRHPKPDKVKQWEKRQECPKCCHTCERYGLDGVCTAFKEEPPEDFASTEGECDLWLMEIPF